MNRQSIAYWIVTGLFCAAFAFGGYSNVTHDPEQVKEMADLGYPEYVMTILGVFKLAGVVALLIPRTPLLKEWAYAGFTFDLLGAAASHAAVGHPMGETVTPLIVLAIGAGSYFLRPASRKLPG